MTPHPSLAPELPVFLDSSSFPLPRSSVLAWMATDLPMIILLPKSDKSVDLYLPRNFPSPLPWILPKSPKCLSKLVGAPWSLLSGL